MSDRLDRYKYQLDIGFNDWKRLVANPYIAAYDTAFESYKQKTGEQEAADRARAELFVMAASICTGSILMAAVASTSLRKIAGDAVLNFICNRNLDMTFNAVHAATKSKAFMFAVGKLLDEGKSQAAKAVQDAVSKVVTANSNIVANTPMVQDKHLDTFLRNHLACAYSVGLAVEDDRTMSAAQKDQAFVALRGAAIFNPPKIGINEQAMANKIELCMYMNTILNSDFLVKVPMVDSDRYGRMAGAMMAKKTPINTSPRAANYPQASGGQRMSGGLMAERQYVDYDRPGSILRKRIDEVCSAVFKKKFYSDKGVPSHQELLVAEAILIRLARETRPMNISDLKN